jgi:hypothetical protein
MVGYKQQHGHQNKRQRQFRNEGRGVAYTPGTVTAYRTAPSPGAPLNTNTASATPTIRAKEVSGGVEEHIPWIHFSQPVKREGYCGIEMTSGLFAPRRHDNRYYGRAQSQSSEQPTESGADNEVSEWRGRVLEQARKCAGKEHVQCQLAGFHQIFRPVEAQAAERTHGLGVDYSALCYVVHSTMDFEGDVCFNAIAPVLKLNHGYPRRGSTAIAKTSKQMPTLKQALFPWPALAPGDQIPAWFNPACRYSNTEIFVRHPFDGGRLKCSWISNVSDIRQ